MKYMCVNKLDPSFMVRMNDDILPKRAEANQQFGCIQRGRPQHE